MATLIHSRNITKGSGLGRGSFGIVSKGTWLDNGRMKEVALKELHQEYSDDDDSFKEFMSEADTMASLEHPNIIKLYGVCRNPLMMVLELCDTNALHHIRNNFVKQNTKFKWSSQIVQGMDYLEGKRLVHENLALRNILLDSYGNAKISDFGLTRAIGHHKEKAYFHGLSPDGVMLCSWSAPESITENIFTSKSDVWSFGVTLWEIFSEGEKPYKDIASLSELKNIILFDKPRMSQPKDCPEDVYQIMLKCWTFEQDRRPNFGLLYNDIKRAEENYKSHHSRNNHKRVLICIGAVSLFALLFTDPIFRK